MKLLAMTTSTRRGGVALVEDGRVLASSSYEEAKGHAERVFAAIDEVLAAAGCARQDLEGIACDAGPGSFTGVRVGVAAAKGIALALGLPVAGVRSLEAMAAAAFGEGVAREGDVVFAAIDAKKGEVFAGAFDAALREVVTARHVARDAAAALAAEAGARVTLVGEVCAEIDELAAAVVRGPAIDLPDAGWVGKVAAERLARAGVAADPADLEAVYLRAPDALPMAAQGPRAQE